MPASADARTAVSPFMPDGALHRRQIASWANQVHVGHLANTGTVTLTANAQSTTVADSRVSFNSFVGFMPLTANAASELAGGGMWVSTQANESFTITHTSAASADRQFRYALLG